MEYMVHGIIKKMNLTLISIFIAILFVVIATIIRPQAAKAAEMFSFGGLHTVTLPCTCPATASNSIIYIFDYKTKTPMALVYAPYSSKLYSQYNFETGKYELGSYIPGAGAELCQEYSGNSCIPILSDGLIDMSPGFGTSI